MKRENIWFRCRWARRIMWYLLNKYTWCVSKYNAQYRSPLSYIDQPMMGINNTTLPSDSHHWTHDMINIRHCNRSYRHVLCTDGRHRWPMTNASSTPIAKMLSPMMYIHTVTYCNEIIVIVVHQSNDNRETDDMMGFSALDSAERTHDMNNIYKQMTYLISR